MGECGKKYGINKKQKNSKNKAGICIIYIEQMKIKCIMDRIMD